MAQTISFTDFLKEGALRENPTPVIEEVVASEVRPFHIPALEPASEADKKAFWKRLRQFYRTGEQPKVEPRALVPALIAPYLRQGSWETDYPIYLPADGTDAIGLEMLLANAFEALFTLGEAKILRKQKQRLIVLLRGTIEPGNAASEFAAAKKYAFEKLRKIDVHGDEGQRYNADVEKLAAALPEDGILLAFHHEVPLYLLRQQLFRTAKARAAYKKLMQQRTEELHELLKMDAEKQDDAPAKTEGFGFAESMISMESVQKLVPKQASSKMPASRVQRIQEVLQVLNETLSSQENVAHLIVADSVADEFNWNEIFDSSRVEVADLATAFERVNVVFGNNMTSFTRVLVAMHKAELELESKYEEDVHDDYFDHFKWFKLSPEELELFPPVVLCTGSTDLIGFGLANLSNLLASNKPIKVLALTNRSVSAINPNLDWEEASHGFRQELAAIALSHRGTHTVQCAMDKPICLHDGIREALKSVSPALVHTLVPAMGEDSRVSMLKLMAAATSRYFPYLSYNCSAGNTWGSRFNISPNDQPHVDWAVMPFSYVEMDGSGADSELPFTYADYKAMTREKVEELYLVPENMASDYLVPLHNFLRLGQNDLTGKVPYIWLVDEDNRMVRAAVPYMWVQSCQERLDFWNFIQELGGVNSYHVNLALANARTEWEKAKAQELSTLQAAQQKELADARAKAAGEAMEKLANVLLNIDAAPSPAAAAQKTGPVVAKPAVVPVTNTKPEAKATPAATPAAPAQAEKVDPYVDDFKCTSCNDCTEKYPAIFEYNQDKQARVKSNWKGTFEHLVLAAENCPASCIHPGDPANQKEANLDELKKRAAKFN
jgi:ferredoxin